MIQYNFEQVKNKHLDKPAFICGLGPSLSESIDYIRNNREKIITLLSSMFNVLSSIVTYRILLNYFDLSSVGIVGIVNTMTFLCILFFVGPTSHSVLRFYNEYLKENKQSEFLNSLSQVLFKEFKYFSLITLCTTSFFYLYFDKETGEIVFLGFLISVSSSLISTIVNFFESNRIRIFSLIIDSTLPWFKVLVIILFIYNFEKDIKFVFIAQFIASFIYLVIACWVLIKYYKIKKTNKIDENLIVKIRKYSQPYKYWGLPYWLYQSSDKYLLVYFSSTQTIGYYTLLYQFTYTPITIIFGVLMKYLQPKIFQNNKIIYFKNAFNKYIVTYILIILVSAISSVLFLNQIVSFLLGKKIEFDNFHIIILILSSGLYGISDLFSIYFNLLLKNNLLIPLKVFSSIVGILLNIILIYFWIRFLIYNFHLKKRCVCLIQV
jgi:O-antigen/teichoic acid export membrane protein